MIESQYPEKACVERAAVQLLTKYGSTAPIVLNDHVGRGHFIKKIGARWGIPVFDTEVANILKEEILKADLDLEIDLDWAVTFGLNKLRNNAFKEGSGDPNLENVVLKKSGMKWGIRFHRIILGKSLLYIAQQGLTTIDVSDVYNLVPDFKDPNVATIDLRRDSFDPYWTAFEEFVDIYSVGIRGQHTQSPTAIAEPDQRSALILSST